MLIFYGCLLELYGFLIKVFHLSSPISTFLRKYLSDSSTYVTTHDISNHSTASKCHCRAREYRDRADYGIDQQAHQQSILYNNLMSFVT